MFFVKSLYKALQPRSLQHVPWMMVWRSGVQSKDLFLCLGSNLGKDLNSKSASEKGDSPCK